MNAVNPPMPASDNLSLALAYLLRRGGSYTDMSECLFRREGELPVKPAGGVLICHTVSDAWFLTAEREVFFRRFLAALPENPERIFLHGAEFLPLLAERYPSKKIIRLQLWKWPTMEPPLFPLNFDVWPLDSGDIAETLWFDPSIDADRLAAQIERKKVFGACIDDVLAGTAGTNPEGGIDWLAVPEERRGQGLGKTLLLYAIRSELRNGHVPFLYAADNSPVIPMLNAVGMVRTDGDVFLLS